MSDTDHTAPTGRTGLTWLQAGALGTAVSLTVNLVVLAVARAADATMVVDDGGTLHEVLASDVVTASAVPLVVGTVVVALVALRWLGMVRLAQIVSAGFTLLSLAGPLTAETDGGTAATLATMHVVTGVAFVGALEVARRRITADRGRGAVGGAVPTGRPDVAGVSP
jgi:hypothetical protein